jgi:catechol 2,3-dioxygenase-like lactoylglutathione lyase family enzyme
MRASFLIQIVGVLAMSTAPVMAEELRVERFGMYLRVTDLSRSRAFYERVLGKSPYVTNERLVGFDVSGGLLALFHDGDAGLVRGRNAVPYLRVANADTEFSRLKELGVELHDDRVVVEGPLKLFRFVDPDGNLLEIFSVAR